MYITTCVHHHLCTSPVVYIASCVHRQLCTSPLVYITTCVHHHLCTSPLVYIASCVHRQLCTSPVVYITTCVHHHLCTSPLVYIASCVHRQLCTSPVVYIASCVHQLQTSPKTESRSRVELPQGLVTEPGGLTNPIRNHWVTDLHGVPAAASPQTVTHVAPCDYQGHLRSVQVHGPSNKVVQRYFSLVT